MCVVPPSLISNDPRHTSLTTTTPSPFSHMYGTYLPFLFARTHLPLPPPPPPTPQAGEGGGLHAYSCYLPASWVVGGWWMDLSPLSLSQTFYTDGIQALTVSTIAFVLWHAWVLPFSQLPAFPHAFLCLYPFLKAFLAGWEEHFFFPDGLLSPTPTPLPHPTPPPSHWGLCLCDLPVPTLSLLYLPWWVPAAGPGDIPVVCAPHLLALHGSGG